MLGTGWENTEYRSYTFEANDDMDASIQETAESRKRRGKTGMQPSRVEQWRLFEMAMQQWEDEEMRRDDEMRKAEMRYRVGLRERRQE